MDMDNYGLDFVNLDFLPLTRGKEKKNLTFDTPASV